MVSDTLVGTDQQREVATEVGDQTGWLNDVSDSTRFGRSWDSNQ